MGVRSLALKLMTQILQVPQGVPTRKKDSMCPRGEGGWVPMDYIATCI